MSALAYYDDFRDAEREGHTLRMAHAVALRSRNEWQREAAELSRKLEAVHALIAEARNTGHTGVHVDHLELALTDDPDLG